MKEIAKVVKTEGEYATVSMEKKPQCEKCGMCVFPKDAKNVQVFAINTARAKPNDKVVIELKESGKLLGILLVFIVPLLLIGLSFLLNAVLIGNELITLFVCVGLIIVWYVLLSRIDKKLKSTKKFGSEIVAVIEEEKNYNINIGETND